MVLLIVRELLDGPRRYDELADMFPGIDAARPELSIEVRCGDVPMTIAVPGGRVSVQPGHSRAPDLVVTGPPDVTIGLLARHVTLTQAKAFGVAVTGDVRLLRRLEPRRADDVAASSRPKDNR